MHSEALTPWQGLPDDVQSCTASPLDLNGRVLPSGWLARDVVQWAARMLPGMYDAWSPILEPRDILCLLGEGIASVHFHHPWSKIERMPLDAVPDAYLVSIELAALANLKFAEFAGMLSIRDDDERQDWANLLVAEYETWRRDVRDPALKGELVSERAKFIQAFCHQAYTMAWNVDEKFVELQLARVFEHHVGENGGKRSVKVVDPSFDDWNTRIAMLEWLHSRGLRSIFAIRDGCAVVQTKLVSKKLSAEIPSGDQKREDWVDVELLDAPEQVFDDDYVALLAELRELRERAEGPGMEIWRDAIDHLIGGRGWGFRVGATKVIHALSACLPHSVPVRAAITYEIFSGKLRQEDVAAAFGISRKVLRGARDTALAALADAS